MICSNKKQPVNTGTDIVAFRRLGRSRLIRPSVSARPAAVPPGRAAGAAADLAEDRPHPGRQRLDRTVAECDGPFRAERSSSERISSGMDMSLENFEFLSPRSPQAAPR
jgi:hypothetical protein